jgi:hypothetical protein
MRLLISAYVLSLARKALKGTKSRWGEALSVCYRVRRWYDFGAGTEIRFQASFGGDDM